MSKVSRILTKIYDFLSSWTGAIIFVFIIINFVAQSFLIPSGSMKNSLLIGDHLFVKKFSYGIETPHIPWIDIQILPDFDGDGHILKGDMPKRGDIVVFRYPKNPKDHYVKRNFAVGGDEIIFARNIMFLRPHEGDDFIRKNYKKENLVMLNDKLFVKNPYKFKGIHYDKNNDIMGLTLQASKNNQFAMKPIFVKELPEIEEFSAEGFDFNAYYFKVPNGEFFMVGDNRNHSNDSRFWGSVPYKLIVGKPWFIFFSWNSNKEIRWDRIGRFVDTLQTDERFIKEQP